MCQPFLRVFLGLLGGGIRLHLLPGDCRVGSKLIELGDQRSASPPLDSLASGSRRSRRQRWLWPIETLRHRRRSPTPASGFNPLRLIPALRYQRLRKLKHASRVDFNHGSVVPFSLTRRCKKLDLVPLIASPRAAPHSGFTTAKPASAKNTEKRQNKRS